MLEWRVHNISKGKVNIIMGPNTPDPQGSNWFERYNGRIGDGKLLLAIMLAQLGMLQTDRDARDALTANTTFGLVLAQGTDGSKQVFIEATTGDVKPDMVIQGIDLASYTDVKKFWHVVSYIDNGAVRVLNISGDTDGLFADDIAMTMRYVGGLKAAKSIDPRLSITDIHFIGGLPEVSIVTFGDDTRALDSVRILGAIPGHFIGVVKGKLAAIALDDIANINDLDDKRRWQLIEGLAETDEVIAMGRIECKGEKFILPVTIAQFGESAHGKLELNPQDMTVKLDLNAGERHLVITARGLGSDTLVMNDPQLRTLHFVPAAKTPEGFAEYVAASQNRIGFDALHAA